MGILEMASKLSASIGKYRIDYRLIALLGLVGCLLIGVPAWLKVKDVNNHRLADKAIAEGQHVVSVLTNASMSLQRALEEQKTQALATRALRDPAEVKNLTQHLQGRFGAIRKVQLYPPRLFAFDPAAAGPNGYALLDMMLTAQRGLNTPLQMHRSLKPPMLLDVEAVKNGKQIIGYMAVTIDPGFILSRFNSNVSGISYVSLSQNNGRQAAAIIKQFGRKKPADMVTEKLLVGGTLFRVELPYIIYDKLVSNYLLGMTTVLGALMLAACVFLFRVRRDWDRVHPRIKAELQPSESIAVEPTSVPEASTTTGQPDKKPETVGLSTPKPAPEPPPMRLRYDIQERHKKRTGEMTSVELSSGIFRAYDIRGVVGETLDAGVARQVGQVVGSLALEKDAGPIVVARDGRLSGPALVEGMIEGITSSGCNVLDIGAVPTGVLYFAAHELAAGSGVMITGSHNPPDYNGFKVMIAGETLFGAQICAIYRSIIDGDVRSGQGEVEQRNVISQYREKIAGDIQLERPLRVVIDCGNGIGGVCAADVLRDIGAEAFPLFDEVDGTFPNHHPDPSDPENLKDLIEAVRLMDADIGLALDGDADRLGVVTLGGSIIYPDRVMMLLAMDVLDRVPGATIIYDVKCTGHLAKVIEEAGGKPVMYKTGHSLIKAKMKQLGSPFAGEMSGHFFFGERWYGVDDGIYAAARLLEILAGAEAPPEAILNALPTSISTPELKVKMKEGENHAFIDALQAQAKFEGARVTTIDGVRADYPDGWGLVRASNTTPILVVRFDAESEQALERIKNVFRARMLEINPDLDLPF
jgi:phosphomannomutase/phosphoglucomutase